MNFFSSFMKLSFLISTFNAHTYFFAISEKRLHENMQEILRTTQSGESIKFFNENSSTQKSDLFSEQGKLLICDWSTRDCHKSSPMSCSIPFTTQSDADASKCFKWRKWRLSGLCGTEMVEVKKEGSKQNVLVSDFRKMFARQISEVQLHRGRLQSKCAKTWKFVHNVESMTSSTFECKYFLHIGFIVKAWCSMSSVGLIHYN